MKTSSILAIVACVLLVSLIAVSMNVGPATAQETPVINGFGAPAIVAPQASSPRYQISAYGSQNASGCYVVDRATGKMWHFFNNGNQVKKLSSLPE
jgi:hypothetical protein